MSAQQLYQQLRQADPAHAIEAAALYLENVQLLDAANAVRIVTPEGRIIKRFEANGHWYTVHDAQSNIGLVRQTKAQQMAALVGLDLDLPGIVSELRGMADLINAAQGKPQHFELSVSIHKIMERLTHAGRNYTYSVAACTAFILRDGEPMHEYDDGLAEQKIADWNAAGIHIADFFFLALNFQQGLTEKLAHYAAKLKP